MNNREAEEKLTAVREKEDREWPKKIEKAWRRGAGREGCFGTKYANPKPTSHTVIFRDFSLFYFGTRTIVLVWPSRKAAETRCYQEWKQEEPVSCECE